MSWNRTGGPPMSIQIHDEPTVAALSAVTGPEEVRAPDWSNRALDLLADIYVAATPAERSRIASGVDALNARLRSEPLNEGESRPGGRRITFPPLRAVVFRVSMDRVVRVTTVKRYGK